MGNIDFNNMEWHDAIIESIFIDRGNPGHNDIIEISIMWPSEKRNKIIFTDVYYASMSLGFGVIADETISEAYIIDNDDELNNVKAKWSKHYKEIENMKAYKILTASTGSTIKIFAFSFNIR